MIVKGLIKTINFTDNTCTVRLPIFETAASSGEVVLKAIILIQPGMYNGYAEGDVVFVDFENDKLSQPIVVGKLYLGAGKESEVPSHAALAVSNLNVTKSATLPIDTKLVLEEAGDTVPVESGITSYKSLTDIIKALYKAETDVGQVSKDQTDMVAKIQVEYLSRDANIAGMPASDDPGWQLATPNYRDGYSIWQKTTCYNHRGQILNIEIICLTSISSSAVYRLRCSTKMHAGTNQLEDVRVTPMVKIGTNLEVEDTSAVLSYRWSDGTESSTETVLAAGATLVLTPSQLQAKNLIITAKHQNVIYDSETILYAPLNTPFIILSNESDSIVYEADGVTAISAPVSSKATLYLNGDVLPATYKWTLTDCYTDEDSSVVVETGDTVTIKRVSARTRSGTAVCTATVTENGSFKGKSYSKNFTVTQTRIGENATSFWLSSTCTVHTGQKHGTNIVVTAMKKVGIAPEVTDTNAFIWWKYKTKSTSWTLTAAKYRVNFTFPAETPDDDILLLATHNSAFNPNATGVDLLTDVNIYEKEEIPFSPLNTPILNLTNDMGAFSCKSDGTKINEDETTSTEAELWLNGAKLTEGVTYSWSLTNCATDKNKTGTNAVTTANLTIKTLTANIATAVCTATYKGETYSKTFTVVKQIQGQSLYTIDVYNDFITVPTDENGQIFDSFKDDLPTISLHTLSCYYGGEVVAVADYVTTTPTNTDSLFRIKYTLLNVELYEDESVAAPNFAISDLTADEGLITYELYKGNVKLASAKFEATKLRQGVSATSCWVDYTSRVHRGTNQQSNITATAWEKFGNLAAQIDSNRYIRYGWRQSNGDFGDFSSLSRGSTTVAVGTFKNADLVFELGTWDGTDFTVQDSEIISYSPIDTPILDLSNDSATLAYTPNNEKLGSDTVSSIASVYLNGEILTEGVTYSWSPTPSGTTTSNVIEDSKTVGSQITVAELAANTVEFKCTATINNQQLFKNEIKLEKVFTVTKQIQGQYSISYWVNISTNVHLGVNQQTPITITAMQKVGTEAIEDIDENAKLYYRYADTYSWTEVSDPAYTVTLMPTADKDLIIKATHLDEDTEIEYDTETITYSPLNTPALDLDNDTDTILYSADGTQLLGVPVTSTATLYLNGDPLAANYNWILFNGLVDAEDMSSTAVGGQTVTVSALLSDTARAVCTATVTATGPFQGKQYAKAFTVSKVRKGDNAISYSLVMDQQGLPIDPATNEITIVRLSGTCYVHDGNSVQPFGNATYKYDIDASGNYVTSVANADGTFTFEAGPVTSQVEVCLEVDGHIVDKEIIKTIPAGVSIVSQTMYYALVHPNYTVGTLKAPSSDSDLIVRNAGNVALLRLDQASSEADIAAAETWSTWSTNPPAHTDATNGWKYWTTVRTEFSSSTAGHYSTPIINEDLSSIYAIAEGKTTNYYSAEDPSTSYTMKEGDCWFHTDEEVYEYYVEERVPTTGNDYIGYYVTPDDTNPTTYILVTGGNLQELLDGDELMTLVPGKNKIYNRSYLGPGGSLYQWVGTASSGYWKDIGEEVVANKVTANYINALKITAKRVKVLDTDNTTLFEADGLDGNHKVTIGGFEVKKNTLTTGDTGRDASGLPITTNNQIKLSSDSNKSWSINSITSTEINNTSWTNYSWPRYYPQSETPAFKQTQGLATANWDGYTLHDLFEYSAANNLSKNADDTYNNFYAVTKLTFNETVTDFDIYLNHNSGDNSDYMIASIPATAGSIQIPTAYNSTSTKTSDYGDGTSSSVTKVHYDSITSGQSIYIVYVHGSSSHSSNHCGAFYIPATNIRLSIGDKFQVLSDGTVYAKDLYLVPDSTGTEDAGGRLEAAEAKIYEIETEKLSALEAQIGAINTNKIEVKNSSNTTIFKADGVTSGLADGNRVQIGGSSGFKVGTKKLYAGSSTNYVELGTDAIMLGGNTTDAAPFSVTKAGYLKATSGEIGGFNISGTGITSDNSALQLGSDGTLYATSANIEGNITANGGQIAGLQISPTSLSSDYLEISNQAVWFKDAGYFQMGEDFSISSQTINRQAAVVMQTLGAKDLYLKNTTGAGIKFNATDVSQSSRTELQIKNIKITPHEVSDAGSTTIYTDVTFTLSFDYEWTNGSGSLTDIYGAVDFKVSHEYWNWGDHSDPYTCTVQFCIKGGTTKESLSFKLGEDQGVKLDLSGTQTYTIHGIRKTGINNAFGTSNFTYYSTDTSGTNKTLYSLGSFCPNTTSTSATTGFFLGDDSHVWNTIRAYTAVISTSDARVKTDVNDLTSAHDTLFDNLRPVSYKYINGDSKRTHVGFIAQEVEKGLQTAGIDNADFAGLCIGKDEDSTYALRYEEFIPLNTAQIQKLKKQIAAQDARIKELERIVKELKT